MKADRSGARGGIAREPTSLSDFLACIGFSLRTIQAPKSAMMRPWPASPNMTANRKGKVMIVYGIGFTCEQTEHSA